MHYLWQFYLLIAVVFIQGLLLGSSKSGRFIFASLCFLELALLSGFRDWNIGNDTPRYISAFILSINYPELLKSHMEWGYLWFNRFLGTFTTNPQILLLTTSLFIMGAWLRTFYKYSIALVFSVILFVILGYDTTLTMIRQEISTGLVLLAIPFIVRRQFIPFFVVVLAASTFHTSAVLATALYFLYPLPFKSKHALLVILVAIGAFIFLAPILDQIISITGRYGGYKGNILLGEETKLASWAKTAVQGAIMAFLLFSYKYILPKENRAFSPLPLPFLLWCSIVAFCMQFISIRGTVLERLVLYFSAFNFISIPYFTHAYPKKIRAFVVVGLVVCFVLYKSIIFVYRPEWNHVLPFEFCF